MMVAAEYRIKKNKKGTVRKRTLLNGINQFTFWGELVFSLPKSANNPFSKGLAF